MAHHATNPHTHDAFAATLTGAPTPEPTDLWAGYLGQRPTLAPGLLPPVIERLAFDAAHRLASVPGPVALSALCAAAGAIRAGWRISGHRNNGEWTEPPILWGAISGSSGAKKSALLETGTAPLAGIQRDWQPDYRTHLHPWKTDKAAYDKAIAAHKRGQPVPAPMDDEPAQPRLTIGNATIEKAKKICRGNPAGVLMVRDEITALTASFGADRASGLSAERAEWITGFGGRVSEVDRIGRGDAGVASFAVSIIGGIQDDTLARQFRDTPRGGFLARFLFAEAPKPADISRDEPADLAARDEWAATLDALANAATGQVVRLSPDACEWRAKMEWRAKGIPTDAPASWDEHAAKWPGMFLRLCLICHLIEHADAVRAEQPVPEVSGDLAERVFRLMVEWLEPEAARVHFSILNRTHHRRAGGDLETIAEIILRRGRDRLTWGDLTRDNRPLREIATADGWRLLDTLAEHGWLSARQVKNGKCHWIVNPAVFDRFRERREALTGRAPVQSQATGRDPHDSVAPTARERADLHAADQGDPDAVMRLARRGRDLPDFVREIGPDCEPDDPVPFDPEEDAARWAAYADEAGR